MNTQKPQTGRSRSDRKEYLRQWRKTHKQNIAASQIRYWSRKAAEQKQQDQTTERGETYHDAP